MIICPNKKNPEVAREFNELVQATSEQAAYHIWSLNNGNAIDKAPNGAESKLFLTLLEHYNGDRTKAIQAKAKTYGNSFLIWFGDWTGNYEESLNSEGVTKEVQDNGKIRLSLPTHTEEHPRLIVLEPQGDNKYYVHMRIWDDVENKTPGDISNEDKNKLFNALYKELPVGAEILFPKSGEGYYGTRGTVAGLMRLAKDKRFDKGSKGTLLYKDKDGSIKEYEGTSFIKIDMKSASKVVDENGEPLVVYRGGNWETRNGAYYFTPNKDYASRYTGLEGGTTQAFFLNIKNINNIKGAAPIIRSDGKKVASRGLFENPWNEEDINILLSGKDGAHSDGEYLVNDLNQIKSIDNQDPASQKNFERTKLYVLNNVPVSKQADTEKDYALTRQIKGFINSEITILNSERMNNNKPVIDRNSDIAVSKQTFSSSNGKYVIVRKLSDNISDFEFNKLYKDLLNKETDFDIQASIRKGDILVMSNKYNISTEDFISTLSHDFDPVQYYKLLIFNEPKESAIAILEQLLSDVETQQERLAILGLITELNCR